MWMTMARLFTLVFSSDSRSDPQRIQVGRNRGQILHTPITVMVMTAPFSMVFHCIVIQQKNVSFYSYKVFLEFV